MMQVTEIFRSIQGESTYAGLPCIFVRLTGCNLRCTWCDTAYAFYGGTRMSIDDVLGRIRELSGNSASGSDMHALTPLNKEAVSLVELTGGEPLLQPDTVGLAQCLTSENYTVLVETSGERFVGILPQRVVKIVDVKCPDSGEAGGLFHGRAEWAAIVNRKGEVCVVVPPSDSTGGYWPGSRSIYMATAEDFITSAQRIYTSRARPSHIVLPVVGDSGK